MPFQVPPLLFQNFCSEPVLGDMLLKPEVGNSFLLAFPRQRLHIGKLVSTKKLSHFTHIYVTPLPFKTEYVFFILSQTERGGDHLDNVCFRAQGRDLGRDSVFVWLQWTPHPEANYNPSLHTSIRKSGRGSFSLSSKQGARCKELSVPIYCSMLCICTPIGLTPR